MRDLIPWAVFERHCLRRSYLQPSRVPARLAGGPIRPLPLGSNRGVGRASDAALVYRHPAHPSRTRIKLLTRRCTGLVRSALCGPGPRCQHPDPRGGYGCNNAISRRCLSPPIGAPSCAPCRCITRRPLSSSVVWALCLFNPVGSTSLWIPLSASCQRGGDFRGPQRWFRRPSLRDQTTPTPPFPNIFLQAGAGDGPSFPRSPRQRGYVGRDCGGDCPGADVSPGHATPAVALRYQHATPERDRAIADRLGVLLRPELPTDAYGGGAVAPA